MSRSEVQAISVFMMFVILAPSAVSAQQGLTTTQWRDDLNFMVSHMEKIHPALFANVEEIAFRRAAKELSDRMADMSDYEIIVALLRLTAMLEDGHTRLHGNKLSDYWFPVRIEGFVDGLYVTAVSKEHSDILGRRVIEIAGRPAKDVFEAVKAITPHDNEYSQIYTASLYLTMASMLSGLGLIEDSRKLTLTTMNPDAEKEMRVVSAHEFASDQDMYAEVLAMVLKVMASPFGVFGYLDEAGALVVPTMTREIWDKCRVPGKTIVFPRESWGRGTWPKAILEKRTIHSNVSRRYSETCVKSLK